MGSSGFEVIINLIKMLAIFLLMVQLVPILVWVERRGSAFIQNRFGPNRVGPLGLTQLLADAVKFLFKEEFRPPKSVALMFYAAPVVALIPGALAFGAIPLSAPFTLEFGGKTYSFLFQSFHINAGIVFVLAVSSLGTYSLLFAGWGSGNKYSLMGALRASAQMISYELALGLSLVGILMIYGTFSFAEMIEAQKGPLRFMLMGKETVLPFLPNWGIFFQPLGFILFFSATFAETNRAPFDLPEAEAELVAGYHTEYGGLKMLMFYIGEYGHMMVASALLVTFYFGGWDLPFGSEGLRATIGSDFLYSLTMFLVFLGKILFFLWVFIWVRWTVPRFRYDQLMDLGWKSMLPWALFNTVLTAVVVMLFNSVGN
jgi:NADH-quinone oxidoreductase subunit H